MPKNVLQDVMPPKKRSIRNVPLSTGKKKTRGQENKASQENRLSNFSGPIDGIKTSQSSHKSSMAKWWILIIIVLIGVLVSLSVFFSGAKIILEPKQEVAEFSTNLTGVRDGSGSEESGVAYSILTISNEGSRTTSNVTEKDVDKKASGEITVFNNSESSPLRLVKNTRFETPDGLIYRTPKSVVVPGRSTKEGKVIPGSVTITVYADSPGEEYNIGLVDFTIPGFKGTDRFSKFYARSKTSMIEGFSGVMKVVPDSELKQMREEIQADLTEELRGNVYSQIQENFVLYEGGIYIDFESQSNIDLGDSVQIVEKGVLTAVLFDKKDLSNYIAKNVINLSEGGVEILNIDELDFSIHNREYVTPWDDTSFEFRLGGLANFVWVFDEEKMKNDFAGQPKKNINSILSKYEGIKGAEVIMSPLWKMSFPKDVDKIKVERVLE